MTEQAFSALSLTAAAVVILVVPALIAWRQWRIGRLKRQAATVAVRRQTRRGKSRVLADVKRRAEVMDAATPAEFQKLQMDLIDYAASKGVHLSGPKLLGHGSDVRSVQIGEEPGGIVQDDNMKPVYCWRCLGARQITPTIYRGIGALEQGAPVPCPECCK